MDRDVLQRRADALRWFHSIDLGQGVVTKGVDATQSERLARLRLPENLSGRSVLDIGACVSFDGGPGPGSRARPSSPGRPNCTAAEIAGRAAAGDLRASGRLPHPLGATFA